VGGGGRGIKQHSGSRVHPRKRAYKKTIRDHEADSNRRGGKKLGFLTGKIKATERVFSTPPVRPNDKTVPKSMKKGREMGEKNGVVGVKNSRIH